MKTDKPYGARYACFLAEGMKGICVKKEKKTLSSPIAVLQQGLTGERSLIGGRYMDNPDLLAVYRDYYWPVSREQTRYVLKESLRFRPHGFLRILDVGSGPGPVTDAFIENGAEAAFLVDQSSKALSLAKKMLPKDSSIQMLEADISKPDAFFAKLMIWGQYDCVTFGHSLNELWANQDDRISLRVDLIEQYSQGLAPGGCVLVIEPALLSTSRDALEIRDRLVSRGWRVCAPCPGRAALPCPAFAAGPQHTCHDELAWKMPPLVASLASSMKIDKESLKMTWFFLQPPYSEDILSEVKPTVAEVGVKGEISTDVYRVVSEPMLNKAGRIRRLLCGRLGRFPISAVNGSPEAVSSGFSTLRRGDDIRVENPISRENGWGVCNETRIVTL